MNAQDFDISGVWDTMLPDAEIISLLCTILTRLEIGDFTVKVCHSPSYSYRFYNVFCSSSITEKSWTVSSKSVVSPRIRFEQSPQLSINWTRVVTIDSDYDYKRVYALSQMPWVEVKKEMTDEKGLDSAVADKIGEYVKHKGM